MGQPAIGKPCRRLFAMNEPPKRRMSMTNNAINAFHKALPCATSSRMLIDMANSLDVADDHLRVKARRDGFFSRMLNAFTGQGNSLDRKSVV